MTQAKRLKSIDAALEAEREDIAEANTRIKDLQNEREKVTGEIAVDERRAERAEQIKRGEEWLRDDPKGHAEFIEKIREQNRVSEIEGFLSGWWDLDDNGRMAAPPQIFHLSDFSEVKNPLMAHVMVKLKIFPSIGQARKAGWDKPLTIGEWTVTKKKLRFKVVA